MKTDFFDIASALGWHEKFAGRASLFKEAVFNAPLLGEYRDTTPNRPLG